MKRMTVPSLLLFALAALVGLSSCDALDPTDRLDQQPSGRLDREQVFSQYETTESFLASLYQQIPVYFDRYWFFSMHSGASDLAAPTDVQFQIGQWNQGNASPSNHIMTFGNSPGGPPIWNTFYSAIRQTNLFLENLKPASAFEQLSNAERKQWIAEARVLRAFFHAELLRNYGAQDQGIPVADRTYPADYDFSQISRKSYDSTAVWIANECEEAAQNLPPDRGQSRDGRATSAWAYAVKSRTLLYAASPLNNPSNDISKWRRAAEAAKQVLDLDEYALYDQGEEPYYELFVRNDDGSGSDYREMIWQLEANNAHFNNVNAVTRAGGFKAGMVPTQNLVDMYEMKNGELPITGYRDAEKTDPIINEDSGYDPQNPYANRDDRLFASVYYNGHPWGENPDGTPIFNVETFVGGADGLASTRSHTRTGYYVRKWITPEWYSTQSAQAHWVIFRLAEFYLNYAEAVNEAIGPNGSVNGGMTAVEAVNAVRARADQPPLPSGLSQSEMRQRIRRERAVELAFENHRFYDVRRWDILSETGKRVTGMRITQNEDGTFAYNRFVVEERQAWEDRYLVRPVPTAEVTRLGVEQHELWQ